MNGTTSTNAMTLSLGPGQNQGSANGGMVSSQGGSQSGNSSQSSSQSDQNASSSYDANGLMQRSGSGSGSTDQP